jgi:hypothetical protein
MKWKDVERVVIELTPDEYTALYMVVAKARQENIRPAVKASKALERHAIAWQGDEPQYVRSFDVRERYGIEPS